MSRRGVTVTAVAAGLALGCAGAFAWLLQAPSSADADPDAFVMVPHLYPADPITQVPHRPVREASDVPAADELVLGVTAGGEARAYPINMMNHPPARKVLNDTLGGQAILATWCDACHTAAVYAPEVDGEVLTFAVSGKLWKDSLVMYDLETHSHWSQLLGEAKLGKLAGKCLRRLPAVLTDWRSWSRQYPEGTVAWLPYTGAELRREAHTEPGKYVFGVAADGKAKAWEFDRLLKTPVVNDQWDGRPVLAVMEPDSLTPCLYERAVGGRVLTFAWSGGRLTDGETGSHWEVLTGKAVDGPLAGQELTPLPGLVSYRDAWRQFYPRSE